MCANEQTPTTITIPMKLLRMWYLLHGFIAQVEGAHLGAGGVPGNRELILLRCTREASLGASGALHDLGHVLGAAGLSQARHQLVQNRVQWGLEYRQLSK